jgi:hypothetical protein
MAGYNETDTKGYRFIIFVLSLTVFIVTTIMTFKYRQVLDTDDDTLIGMSRGTVIWFYWLNIILAIISFFVFFINLFKILFGKKSIGSLIPKFLTEENNGIFEYNNESQVASAVPVAKAPVAAPAPSALNIARGEEEVPAPPKVSKSESPKTPVENSGITYCKNKYIKAPDNIQRNAVKKFEPCSSYCYEDPSLEFCQTIE